jgi:enhancing lycopene biosynthesis protein 2
MKKIGIILSGCGFQDGSDPRESVLILLQIEKRNCQVQFASVKANQKEVINHRTQETIPQSRDILVESARLSGTNIQEIKDLSGAELDALVIPGGQGVVKNLGSAVEGSKLFKTYPDLRKLLREMFRRKKPIGGCGLASLVIAESLSDICETPLTLTLGNDPQLAQQLEKLEAVHVIAKGDEAIMDEQNRIVTTPGAQLKQKAADFYGGVENLIEGILELTS